MAPASIMGQLKVNIEWQPQCACQSPDPPVAIAEVVDGSSEGTPTGVQFSVRYHVRCCPVCSAPFRMTLARV